MMSLTSCDPDTKDDPLRLWHLGKKYQTLLYFAIYIFLEINKLKSQLPQSPRNREVTSLPNSKYGICTGGWRSVIPGWS